ncbi:hypothetical protein RvY_02952 [Ramazzottius varieornatus]|uniref:Large ribosomal subunit protein mL54 n=1 Tax=Ramazzottius varieornatus TaxID=947166 RepID=A0A1D1UPV6_RAMVA|nr:hypothetical protein RvY_02952 [Ramazzottius varieornatus]
MACLSSVSWSRALGMANSSPRTTFCCLISCRVFPPLNFAVTTTSTTRKEKRILHTTPTVNAPPAKPGKAGGAFKAGMTVVKKKMEVETDPHKLVNYLCGGNYVKDSPEIKLKPDSEYPDWLWNLRTTGPPSLDELDPNSLEYWYKVREIRMKEERMLQKAVKGKRWLLRSKGKLLE